MQQIFLARIFLQRILVSWYGFWYEKCQGWRRLEAPVDLAFVVLAGAETAPRRGPAVVFAGLRLAEVRLVPPRSVREAREDLEDEREKVYWNRWLPS